MDKHFVLIVTFANSKKSAFLTNNADLASALAEFRNIQIKSRSSILEDKSYSVLPEIISAEVVKLSSIF